jgi:MFS family permease
MAREKRTVLLLAACLALGMTVTTIIMTSAAVAGTIIAPRRSLATMPVALMFVGTMLTPLPLSWTMGRYGRRAGFMIGALFGIAGGTVATTAMLAGSFALLCAGMVLLGVAAASNAFYRFAAADAASPAFRPTAISWVMAGGIVAALLGPNLARWTKDLLAPIEFAGTFAVLPALQAATLLLLAFIDLPRPVKAEVSGPVRPLGELARQPAFVAAVAAAVAGYAVMNMVMTSTPLAVIDCGYGFSDAAFVLQWHVLGMYVPAFFTGSLIRRWGTHRIIAAGLALFMATVALGLAGQDLTFSFLPGLILLGVGWNFLYVGGTTLLTETHTAAEKAKVQGFNDFLVFTAVAMTALSSGGVHEAGGWQGVNLVALVLSAVAVLLMGPWLRMRFAAGRAPA